MGQLFLEVEKLKINKINLNKYNHDKQIFKSKS